MLAIAESRAQYIDNFVSSDSAMEIRSTITSKLYDVIKQVLFKNNTPDSIDGIRKACLSTKQQTLIDVTKLNRDEIESKSTLLNSGIESFFTFLNPNDSEIVQLYELSTKIKSDARQYSSRVIIKNDRGMFETNIKITSEAVVDASLFTIPKQILTIEVSAYKEEEDDFFTRTKRETLIEFHDDLDTISDRFILIDFLDYLRCIKKQNLRIEYGEWRLTPFNETESEMLTLEILNKLPSILTDPDGLTMLSKSVFLYDLNFSIHITSLDLHDALSVLDNLLYYYDDDIHVSKWVSDYFQESIPVTLAHCLLSAKDNKDVDMIAGHFANSLFDNGFEDKPELQSAERIYSTFDNLFNKIEYEVVSFDSYLDSEGNPVDYASRLKRFSESAAPIINDDNW